MFNKLTGEAGKAANVVDSGEAGLVIYFGGALHKPTNTKFARGQKVVLKAQEKQGKTTVLIIQAIKMGVKDPSGCEYIHRCSWSWRHRFQIKYP